MEQVFQNLSSLGLQQMLSIARNRLVELMIFSPASKYLLIMMTRSLKMLITIKLT